MNIFKKWLVCIEFFGISLLLPPLALASSFEDFFSAIRNDDVAVIQRLAQRGFDLNTVNQRGEHALFLAMRDDAVKVAAYLLSQPSVQVEVRTVNDESPLMMAALKGRLALAHRLIEREAEVNKPGWAPLHYAATDASAQAPAMVRLLLEHHAYIDAESPNGTTPLMMAAHYGTPQAVRLLLDEGADPTLKNQLGLSAIDFAQRANRADVAAAIAAAIRQRSGKGTW